MKPIWILIALCVLFVAISVGFLFSNRVAGTNIASTLTSTSTTSGSSVHFDLYMRGIAIPLPYVSITTSAGEKIATHPNGVVTFTPPLHNQTLGDIVRGLGQTLTPSCFGPFCAFSGTFRFYINGNLYQGTPAQIPLTDKEEILIVAGPQLPAHIPVSYTF